MKKRVLLLAICLLGICYVHAQQSIQETEIVLTEVGIAVPLDSPNLERGDCPPPPTRFGATQDGTTITAQADTEDIAHVTIRDKATGTTVADQDFVGITSFSVPANGSYTIRIQSAGTAVEGYFTTR